MKHSTAWGEPLIARLAAEDPPLAAGEVRHRVLFQPAFHATTLITALLGPRPSVALAVPLGPWSEEAPPAVHRDAARLEADAAARFAAVCEQCAPHLDDPDPRLGLDGVSLVIEIAAAGGPTRTIGAWSPDAGEARHTYVAALYELAAAALVDELAQATLERLHAYLHVGLPLREDPGPPRRVRIFGRLTSRDEAALTQRLAAIPADVPLLVDMRNFEGMGTLLYPLFRRLDRRARIAWLCSRTAERQLAEAGIAEARRFRDLVAAQRSLAAPA